MQILSIFLALQLGQISPNTPPAALIEILKDAQHTNRQAIRNGSADFELSFDVGVNSAEESNHLKGKISWIEEDFVLIYHIFGHTSPLLGGKSDKPNAVNLVARSRDFVYIYNPVPNAVMKRRTTDTTVHPLLMVNPWENWFRCCPPNTRDGRLWLDLIGRNPLEGVKSDFALTVSADGSSITQVRNDDTGAVFETTYSMKAGGNVVKTSLKPGKRSTHSFTGEYDWKQVAEGVFVLTECRFDEVRNEQTKRMARYVLRFSNVRLAKAPEIKINELALTTYLPAGIKVHEEHTGKTYRLKGGLRAAEKETSAFSSLIETAKSRGFALGSRSKTPEVPSR